MRAKCRDRESGQVLVLFAVVLVLLILFAGLAIDLGLGYVAKTALSRAVDSAALSAMRNINRGQATARSIAQNAFDLNYQAGRNSRPLVTVGITTAAALRSKLLRVGAEVSLSSIL